MRIAIVGYGVAGIAVAILLRRAGHEIDHFERRRDVAVTGAGLILNRRSLALLDLLDVGRAIRANSPKIDSVSVATRSGRNRTQSRHALSLDVGIGVERSRLAGLLMKADGRHDRVRFGVAVARIDSRDGTLYSDDGSALGQYDMVIGADGANSSLRDDAPELGTATQGSSGTAVVACVNARTVDSPCLQMSYDGIDHVSCWPVGDFQEAPRLAIATNFQSGQDCWHDMVVRLMPQLRSDLEVCRPVQTIKYRYRDVHLQRWSVGRLLFLGDAAHAMSPQLGMGVQTALQDAVVLSATMTKSDDVSEIFQDFERQRRSAASRLRRISLLATPLFQSDSQMLATLRDRLVFPVIATAMRHRKLIGRP